jgi:hypothetical protein
MAPAQKRYKHETSAQWHRAILSCQAGWIRTNVPVDAPLGTAPLAKLPSLRPTSTCTHSTPNQSRFGPRNFPSSHRHHAIETHNQIGSNSRACSPRSISPRTSTVGLPRLFCNCCKVFSQSADRLRWRGDRCWWRTRPRTAAGQRPPAAEGTSRRVADEEAEGRLWRGPGALQMRSRGGGRGGAEIADAYNEWRRLDRRRDGGGDGAARCGWGAGGEVAVRWWRRARGAFQMRSEGEVAARLMEEGGGPRHAGDRRGRTHVGAD